MTRFIYISAITCVAFVICSGQIAIATDRPNFTGKYSAEQKNTNLGVSDSSIELTQSSDVVDIVRVEKGKKTISHCPLQGSDGEYMSPSGFSGKCKAQLKSKYLIVESTVLVKPQPSSPAMRIHTRERWQLSADGKKLTIKSSTDFPDVPAAVSAAVADGTDSTIKYLRVETP